MVIVLFTYFLNPSINPKIYSEANYYQVFLDGKIDWVGEKL